MDTKHFTTQAILKAEGDAEGSIEAVFSSFGVRDRWVRWCYWVR